MHLRNLMRAGLALLALPLFGSLSQASLVTWTLDQANSSIALAIPQQQVTIDGTGYQMRVVNQNASGSASGSSWTTGNSAHYSGTIATNYVDGSSIQFLTGLDNVNAVQSFTQAPNPANFVQNPSLDPGEGSYTGTNGGVGLTAYDTFAQIQVLIFVGVGPVAINAVMLDLDSTSLPITGTSFAATNTNLGIQHGSLGVDITSLLVSGALGFSGIQTTFSTADNDNSTTTLGSITVTGPLTRKLTLPVAFPISINSGDFTLLGSATGVLAANATLTVPEPGTMMLAAIATATLCGVGARRRNGSRRR